MFLTETVVEIIFSVATIEVVSADSGRPLKVGTPHFHFDSSTKKKDTHLETELLSKNPFLIAVSFNRFCLG